MFNLSNLTVFCHCSFTLCSKLALDSGRECYASEELEVWCCLFVCCVCFERETRIANSLRMSGVCCKVSLISLTSGETFSSLQRRARHRVKTCIVCSCLHAHLWPWWRKLSHACAVTIHTSDRTYMHSYHCRPICSCVIQHLQSLRWPLILDFYATQDCNRSDGGISFLN